jgi:hypothetical protein
LLIKNPPLLYSLVDKVLFGLIPQINLSPDISITNSPEKKPQALVAIELKPFAMTPSLEKSFIPDENDSQNNNMDSGHKTPLEAG